MRVGFVCPNLQRGGAERHWSVLVPALAERGHSVRVLTLDGEGHFFAALRDRGIPVRCLSLRLRLDLPRLASGARWLAGSEVLVSRSVSALLYTEAVASAHRSAHVFNEHLQVGRALTTRRERLVRVASRGVDGVVAVSSLQVPDLVARGFPEERISVVPNAVDESAFTQAAEPAALRARLGWADDELVALNVAALRPEKRHDIFIAAIETARRQGTNVRGAIAGAGPGEAHVRALAESAPGVELLGARDDVAELMGAADVVCLTSEIEGVPMALLEAMAAGRPVVATAVGGVAEAVVDGETGILVPADDEAAVAEAFATLARDPERRRRLGERGRERQRALFSFAAMVRRYEQAFLAALRGRKTKRT